MSLEKQRVFYSLMGLEFQVEQKMMQIGWLFSSMSILDLIKLYDKKNLIKQARR